MRITAGGWESRGRKLEVGLDRLVANLLDLTRLKSHAIQLQRELQTLQVVAETTLARAGDAGWLALGADRCPLAQEVRRDYPVSRTFGRATPPVTAFAGLIWRVADG